MHANMQEVLLWALLAVRNAERYGKLDTWAREACSEYSAATVLKEQWKPPDRFGKYKQVSAIFAPIVDVMDRTWGEAELATIGTAMRAASWHAGQHDNLDWRRLSDHINGKRRGVRPPGSKREGPQRWRTWSIVLVADTVKRHRKALVDLLGLDQKMEDVPTAAQVIAARDATIAERDATIAKVKEELTKEKEKLRKAAERNKTALQRKTQAVRSERERQQQKAHEKIAKALEKEKGRLEKKEQLMKEGLEAAYADDYASALAKVAKARARARKVEAEAKLSRKRLSRAQTAEAKVKELEANQEEEEAEEERPASPTTDDEPEAKIARRNERGQFAPLDWRLRELILTEEARRTPPTAIAANITDVLRVFASPPLPSSVGSPRRRHPGSAPHMPLLRISIKFYILFYFFLTVKLKARRKTIF